MSTALPPFDDALAHRLLDAIEHDVLPPTEAGVAAGNEMFGTEHHRRENAFRSGYAIRSPVTGPEAAPGQRPALSARERVRTPEARYATLSARYRASKADDAIPLR